MAFINMHKYSTVSRFSIVFFLHYTVKNIFLPIGGKPDNLDFLNESINDINNLLSEVIYVKQCHLKLVYIICDTPAKSFIKQIIQYNGYHGCDRCDQIQKI